MPIPACKLLAFETSGEACSVALWIDGEVRQRLASEPRRHAELVLAMAEELLAEAGLRLRDLDTLAFGRGPGSFTGVRIATAVVQGAAFGGDLPVVPVSTLAAMAQGALRCYASRASLIALDARMAQVYWGAYQIDSGENARLVGQEAVIAPEHARVPGGEGAAWLGVGSGWSAYAAALTASADGRLSGIEANHPCEARDIARLAATLFAEGRAVAAEAAVPVYLRDQVTHRR